MPFDEPFDEPPFAADLLPEPDDLLAVDLLDDLADEALLDDDLPADDLLLDDLLLDALAGALAAVDFFAVDLEDEPAEEVDFFAAEVLVSAADFLSAVVFFVGISLLLVF
jgi:hypothetical protein